MWILIISILIDQITKLWVMTNFSLGESRDFISGLLNLVYIHNQGAAWGTLSGKKWLLIGITLVVMIVCIGLIIKNFSKSKLFVWSLCLVVSGGLGNLIDRIFRDGNVIDFLQFDFYKSFPIFNFADCCIVVGCILMCFYVIFIQKDKSEIKTIDNEESHDGKDNN